MMQNPETDKIQYSEIIEKIQKNRVKPFNQFWITSILYLAGIFSIIAVFFIILFLVREAIPFIHNETNYSLWDFVSKVEWHPEWQLQTDRNGLYGAGGILFGSILVTLGSMLFAIPFGIGCAIFIAEIAPPKIKIFLKTAVELLAGIPSIVYGFFGLRILLPFLIKLFPEREKMGFAGSSLLAASIILGIMALPTIVSVSEDALSSAPREYKEASLAMGATKWQTTSKILIPSSVSGITAAVILGMGRAIGETMAVLLVAGNSLNFPEGPWAIFERIRTITATIAIEQKESPFGGDWFHSLFVLGVILFLMTFLINTISSVILKRINERFHPPPKEEEIGTLIKGKNTYEIGKQPINFQENSILKEHHFNDNEIASIQFLFGKFGRKFLIYGLMMAFSFGTFLVAIVTIINFNFAIFLGIGLIAIGALIGQCIVQIILLDSIKQINLRLKIANFNAFFKSLVFGSIFVSFAFLMLIFAIFLFQVNLTLTIVLACTATIILVCGLGFEFYSWLKIREFLLVNPIVIKRKAIEGSKLMYISSIVRLVLVFFVAFFCIMIIISLTGSNELLTWLDYNRVIVSIGILLLMIITVSSYLTGAFRLGRSFAPALTENQRSIKKLILQILFIGSFALFSLYAFNWIVVIIIFPCMIIISIFTKKLTPKINQILSYTLIYILAISVLTVLSILTFYIYKDGLEILGISILIAIGVLALISIIISLLRQKFRWQNLVVWLIVMSLLTLLTLLILNKNQWTLSGEEGFSFFFTKMQESGDSGGILNQILGTFWLVLFTMLVAIPIGVYGGIYLAEYSKSGPLLNIIHSAIDNLNGTPSIVFGLFGLSFFVYYLDFKISLLSGILTMTIMVLPTIIRITEEAIKAVPLGLKEGSYAMGTTKWQAIHKIALPVARPSIITGVVIAMGRVAGETAPILLVAAAFQKRFVWGPFKIFGGSFMEEVQLLPYHILDLTTELQNPVRAGATALVLFIFVLIFFAIATFMRLKYKKILK